MLADILDDAKARKVLIIGFVVALALTGLLIFAVMAGLIPGAVIAVAAALALILTTWQGERRRKSAHISDNTSET